VESLAGLCALIWADLRENGQYLCTWQLLSILQSKYDYHTTMYVYALLRFSLRPAMERPASWKYLPATKSAWSGGRIADYKRTKRHRQLQAGTSYDLGWGCIRGPLHIGRISLTFEGCRFTWHARQIGYENIYAARP
jgi:hypothetical protein